MRYIHFQEVVHSILEVTLLKSNTDRENMIRVNSITPDPPLLDGISLLMNYMANICGRRESQSLDGKGT